MAPRSPLPARLFSPALLSALAWTLGCAGAARPGAAPEPATAAPVVAAVAPVAPARLAVAELSPSSSSPPAPPQADARLGLPRATGESAPLAVAIPGSNLVRGRTTVVVNAPIARVRATVLAFADYPEFMPHYSKCKVLGRTPSGARDLYMEVRALHDAVKLWSRVAFPKPVTIDGLETYETEFIEGNVKDFKAIWRMRALEDGRSELSLEVFLDPIFPLPDELVNQENLAGSASGVAAMRARAERAPK